MREGAAQAEAGSGGSLKQAAAPHCQPCSGTSWIYGNAPAAPGRRAAAVVAPGGEVTSRPPARRQTWFLSPVPSCFHWLGFKANVTKSVCIYSLLDRPSCSTPLKTQELPVLPHQIPPSSASSDGLSCAKFSYILPSIFSEKLHPELYITYLN